MLDQTKVFFVGQVEAALIPVGASVVGFPDHSVAAHQIAVAAVGEGHVQRIGLSVEIHGLPWARCGRWHVGGDATAEADPQHQHQQQLGSRVQQTFHGLTSAQGIKGQEEGKAEGKAAKDQNILLAWRHPVHAQAVIEVFVEAAGLGAGADVTEGGNLAAAHRTAERQWVQIFKGGAGFNSDFLDAFIRVVDVAAAAAFETVRPRIALRSGFDRLFHRLGGFDRLDGLLLVAHRCVAGRSDSIDDNSRR